MAIILFHARGKGDFYRLGHGTDDHVREPKLVESLKDKNIVDVAVGNLHCLAVTEEGEVVFLFMFLFIFTSFNLFSSWCPLKGQTYLNNPAAFTFSALSMYGPLVDTRN